MNRLKKNKKNKITCRKNALVLYYLNLNFDNLNKDIFYE